MHFDWEAETILPAWGRRRRHCYRMGKGILLLRVSEDEEDLHLFPQGFCPEDVCLPALGRICEEWKYGRLAGVRGWKGIGAGLILKVLVYPSVIG